MDVVLDQEPEQAGLATARHPTNERGPPCGGGPRLEECTRPSEDCAPSSRLLSIDDGCASDRAGAMRRRCARSLGPAISALSRLARQEVALALQRCGTVSLLVPQ